MAVIAAFAMLMQGAGSMSMAQASGATVEICTAHGTKTVTLDQAGQPSTPKQAPCPHCDQCMSPALVTLATAPVLVQPVFYAVHTDVVRAAARRLPPARAPPKPPSQGPPSLLNV